MTSFLASQLPPPAEILELPEDELGLRLLRLIVDHGQGDLASRNNVGIPSTWDELGEEATTDEFLQVMVEAWDWLRVQRLVAPRPGADAWDFVTRRGYRVLSAADGLALVRAEARLDVDLHRFIARRVRRQFVLGEYELAALAAMKQVEIRVRELARLAESDTGVPLMRKAFHPETGLLADPSQEGGERQATTDLFAGAIGVFKNPSSHREVQFDDPTYAAEVVLFADLLLRMLDRVEQRLDVRD